MFISFEVRPLKNNTHHLLPILIFDAVYSPQYTLNIHQRGESLYVYGGGTADKDIYEWVKVFTGEKVVIRGDSAFHPPVNGGEYYALVGNKIAPKLVIGTDPVVYTQPSPAVKAAIAAENISQTKLATILSVYPSPARDIVHIQVSGSTTIIVTSAAGKIMLAKVINNSADINVTTFAPGTYYIQNKANGETKNLEVIH